MLFNVSEFVTNCVVMFCIQVLLVSFTIYLHVHLFIKIEF